MVQASSCVEAGRTRSRTSAVLEPLTKRRWNPLWNSKTRMGVTKQLTLALGSQNQSNARAQVAVSNDPRTANTASAMRESASSREYKTPGVVKSSPESDTDKLTLILLRGRPTEGLWRLKLLLRLRGRNLNEPSLNVRTHPSCCNETFHCT